MSKKQVYDLAPYEFYIYEKKELDDGNLLYCLEPTHDTNICTVCGGKGIKHGITYRKVRDIPQGFIQVGLIIKTVRYQCKNCGATWVNDYASIPSSSKMTDRMRTYIAGKSVISPFAEVAQELSVTDTTIKRAFREKIKELDKENVTYSPEILGIDENHLSGNYRAVFVDVEKRQLIEMLEQRSKQTVLTYLNSLPDKERIKVVTMDMWNPYRSAVKEALPNATIVVDKFHVVKEFTGTLDKMRKDLIKKVPKDKKKYLKNNRFLLLSNKEDLTVANKKKLNDLLNKYDCLEKPYLLKEMLRLMYMQPTKSDAESWLEGIRNMVNNNAELIAFKNVFKTLDNWHTEIFNYFDYNYTNASTENLNKMINTIGNSGRGYSFEVLRAKALYKNKIPTYRKFDFPDEFKGDKQ